MREIFRQELEQVGDDLVLMARHVQTAMEHASIALATGDLRLAERVIDDDRTVDQLEQSLDEQCVTLLARQQPVATDLRVVVSALRLSATLERMGDLARHVAQVARGRYPELAVPESFTDVFRRIADASNTVARDVVRLLEGRDLALAATIEADDDQLDALHRETFRLMLAPRENARPLDAQQVVDVTLLGRYYERFGDHGVSVARRIAYLVTGEAYGTTIPDGVDAQISRGA
ncbi:phosphate uptake regulator, PhoU [Beutenbergia cavernae DSM 12333]|uniref:Phosphate-specific transport system accessory protein PhoU n=1 Tax=Beutenbergia cavernae (strain ATCC BAA-8 / DSM 12333 / CCUG 43141 / JCM 11478 / NBRC 16432 / NCIMB 13614 / HKI 0122) TaxID=471853 RepID=C5BYS2_BEUC1|nr:phosphate signaling complex protein PhoU [Beutenbergia cavernae]ACQ79030.1 phosphate uptake regulator, PhoU [Beutenbergia cavernae DSM 12333]